MSLDDKKRGIADQEVQVENPAAHMGLFSGVAMIVGVIVGSGIFATAGPAFNAAGSVGTTLILWVLAGLLTICGGLCYVELGCAMPTSGGEHNYLLRAFGPYVAYVFDWTQSLLALPLAGATISLVFSEYLCGLMVFDTKTIDFTKQQAPQQWMVKLVSIIMILLLTLMNILSAKLGSKISNFTTVLKLGALGFIIGIGLYFIAKGNIQNFKNPFSGGASDPLNYGNALYNQLFAFAGWNNLNYMISELKNPQRNLPLAIVISLLMVISVYLLTNIAYFAILPRETVSISKVIATEVGYKALGIAGAYFIPIMVMLSCVGAVNSMMYGNSRLIASTGKEGVIFPKLLAKLHSKRDTPYLSLILHSVLSCIYCLPPDLEVLIKTYCFVTWIFNLSTVVGLIVLRRTEPDMHRPFKVFLPLAYLFCFVALLVVVYPLITAIKNQDAMAAIPFGLSAVIMILPIPIVYHQLKKKN